jgi:hypothetical protein
MHAQTTFACRHPALSLETVASRLAPTGSSAARTKRKSNPQGAFEKQYRLSLLQVFAMRQ